MKTAKLFGVRFVTEPGWKDQVLQHFINVKTESLKAELAREISQFKITEMSTEALFQEKKKEVEKISKALDFTEVTDFLQDEARCRHYFITAPVLEMSQKIRVKEPFDLEWLLPVPDGKRQLNYGNEFIRYEKKGARIVGLSVKRTIYEQDKNYLNYSFFNMDLDQNRISDSQILDDYAPSIPAISFLDFEAQSRKLFFQLITFMELSKIQEVLIAPGRKHGVKKSPDHLLNDSAFPITIVNTNWNKIIRREGFNVDGHIRKQVWGPGNSKRKLIWIDDYHKNGYNLGAAKVRHQRKPRLGL